MTPTDYAASMDRLAHALATNDQAWLAANYPGAWPWPVSGKLQTCAKTQTGGFDADANERFMKGLG